MAEKTQPRPHDIAHKYGITLNESGKFAPGHDAKLKSVLVKLVLAGGREGTQARKDLEKVGWGKYVPTQERIDAVKAQAEKRAAKAAAAVVAEADAAE